MLRYSPWPAGTLNISYTCRQSAKVSLITEPLPLQVGRLNWKTHMAVGELVTQAVIWEWRCPLTWESESTCRTQVLPTSLSNRGTFLYFVGNLILQSLAAVRDLNYTHYSLCFCIYRAFWSLHVWWKCQKFTQSLCSRLNNKRPEKSFNE